MQHRQKRNPAWVAVMNAYKQRLDCQIQTVTLLLARYLQEEGYLMPLSQVKCIQREILPSTLASGLRNSCSCYSTIVFSLQSNLIQYLPRKKKSYATTTRQELQRCVKKKGQGQTLTSIIAIPIVCWDTNINENYFRNFFFLLKEDCITLWVDSAK